AGQFGARLGSRLGNAAQYFRIFAVLRLAGKFEPDAVRIVEIDADEAGQLRDRSDIVDAARLQPRLDVAKARSGHDEGAMLHRADRVAVAGRLPAVRDLR